MKQAIKNRIMLRSRQSKTDHFYSLCRRGCSVLDVGVSNERHFAEPDGPVNHFLKTYRYPADTYTGLGVCDVSGLRHAFPGKRFVSYDGSIFPFEDNEFDWVFSNAVIEHVGDDKAQLLFVNEMLRVARYVFFTTPNKFFPIETHMHVPFIHWNDRLFQKWMWKYRREWVSRNNLWLLSSGDLDSLMRRSACRDHAIYRNRVLMWPMTLTVVASRLGAVPVGRPDDLQDEREDALAA